jgi:hypothetical protein
MKRKINRGGNVVNGRYVPLKRIFGGYVFTEDRFCHNKIPCEDIGRELKRQGRILSYRVIPDISPSVGKGYALMVRKNPKWRKE